MFLKSPGVSFLSCVARAELGPGFPQVSIMMALGQATHATWLPKAPSLAQAGPLNCTLTKFPSWRVTLKHSPKGLRGMSDSPSA